MERNQQTRNEGSFRFLKTQNKIFRIIIYFFPVAMIEKEEFQININFKISIQKREIMISVKQHGRTLHFAITLLLIGHSSWLWNKILICHLH